MSVVIGMILKRGERRKVMEEILSNVTMGSLLLRS
jgi:hypothetical protein